MSGRARAILVGFVVLASSVLTLGTRVPHGTTTGDNSSAPYGKLALSFEANHGQTDAEVAFLSRGRGYGLFLTPTTAIVSMRGVASSTVPAVSIRMQLLGANPLARISGQEMLRGVSNYFIGRDPTKWRTHVPHYARVRYEETYPGIDLVFYGNDEGRLEYDFILAPGANPNAIRLGFEGVDGLEIDGRGDLVLRVVIPGAPDADAGARTVRLEKPRVHQETTRGRREVTGRYALEGGGTARRVRFEIGPYDAGASLVIDPVLVYSSYLGGGGDFTYYHRVWMEGRASRRTRWGTPMLPASPTRYGSPWLVRCNRRLEASILMRLSPRSIRRAAHSSIPPSSVASAVRPATASP